MICGLQTFLLRFRLSGRGPQVGRQSRLRNVSRVATRQPKRGFTLVEVVICLVIVLLAGIATVGGITYTRLNLELEKQRLAALSYCRQAMEAIQSLDTATRGKKKLVPFNSPNIEDLDAALNVEYYDLNNDGSVNWASSRNEPAINRPVYARVTVTWTPYGSMARPQSVAMSTIVTRGID